MAKLKTGSALFNKSHHAAHKLYRCLSLQGIVIKRNWCLLLWDHLIKPLCITYDEWAQVPRSRPIQAICSSPQILHLPGHFKWADSGLGHQIHSLWYFDLRNKWQGFLNQVIDFFGFLLSSLVPSGVPNTLFSPLWGRTMIQGLNIPSIDTTAVVLQFLSVKGLISAVFF